MADAQPLTETGLAAAEKRVLAIELRLAEVCSTMIDMMRSIASISEQNLGLQSQILGLQSMVADDCGSEDRPAASRAFGKPN